MPTDSPMSVAPTTVPHPEPDKSLAVGYADPQAAQPGSEEGPRNLLAQLDAQQNHVMEELDALNDRIETLLNRCSENRSAKAA